MKPRVADQLRQFGCQSDVEDFRRTLVEVKEVHFAEWSIDELCFTRDEAAEFCQLVKKRLSAPKLPRPFILRALVGIRKNKPKQAKTGDAMPR